MTYHSLRSAIEPAVPLHAYTGHARAVIALRRICNAVDGAHTVAIAAEHSSAAGAGGSSLHARSGASATSVDGSY